MTAEPGSRSLRARLRRTVLLVAGLNLAYFSVEVTVAVAIGSVSLFADSVDFLEDTAINLLIVVALAWSPHRQALAGKAMALVILAPALAAAWQALAELGDPVPPDPAALVLTAGGAAAVNLLCSAVLARFRHHGSSMARAAFLSARNDVLVNLAVVAMGVLTAWTGSCRPDLVLGLVVVVLNAGAAKEVWETAEEERLAARALAGEEID
ncbi:cation transporter [Kocuria rosea]|uniref:cation transporter n=1 Tax=Kocuria rosea TaxID=1275 RepID=UPI00203C79EA|nr:cation transporter [Kocuria rosea]MCM3687891.1 cation transporter [Kocuria rosea]